MSEYKALCVFVSVLIVLAFCAFCAIVFLAVVCGDLGFLSEILEALQ